VLRDAKMFDIVANYSGDTLQCRLIHVSAASVEPGTHCGHAQITPVMLPCADDPDTVPKCTDYCRIVMTSCKDHPVYESPEQCMSVCAALPAGVEQNRTEDTIGCRKYHSYNSVADPVTHCSHAGPGGDGHCGVDNCTGYCTLLAAACPTDFQGHFAGNADQCLTECRTLSGAAKDSGYSIAAPNGNTLQCRLLHVTRAFAEPTACASAAGAGDCQ
jgi:hypothetical protein